MDEFVVAANPKVEKTAEPVKEKKNYLNNIK